MNRHISDILRCATAALLMLCSCGAENEYNTTDYCYFTYDTSLHPVGALKDAVSSPSLFAYVYLQTRYNVRYVCSELNDGQTKHEDAITTAKENYQSWVLGKSNGLIIGCNDYNVVCAYDRQCPNCTDDNPTRNAPLTWTANGRQVSCALCKRKYDLNNNGYVVDGGGKALDKYRTVYSGTMLVVRN